MNWIHNQKEILSTDDMPIEAIGFIYVVTYDDGSLYIGKKQVRTFNETDALKSGDKRDNHIKFVNRHRLLKGETKVNKKTGKLVKTTVQREVVATETKWQKYTGSNEIPKGLKVTKKEILMYCSDKVNLAYYETMYLFKYDAILSDKFLNKNILGKFFEGKIHNIILGDSND